GAAGDAVPLARALLDDAGRGREVDRRRLARHVGVAVRVERDVVDDRAARAGEVRGVHEPRTVGTELRDESAYADDAAAAHALDRIDEWKVARRGRAGDVRVAIRVDDDAGRGVVSLAA